MRGQNVGIRSSFSLSHTYIYVKEEKQKEIKKREKEEIKSESFNTIYFKQQKNQNLVNSELS